MERKLLVLGLLMNAEMHGYQINEMIEMHLGSGIQLKKSLVYKLLTAMTKDGWLIYTEEREGNRPTRRVYTISEKGKAAFQELLRDSLADYKPADFLGHIAIGYLDMLPPEQSVPLLLQRRQKIEVLLQKTQNLEIHHGSHQLTIDHQIHHYQSELEWLDEVIEKVKGTQNGK